jgi:hypothetical protein
VLCLAVAVGLVGCGGGSSSGGTTTAKRPATKPVPRPAVAGRAIGSTQRIQARGATLSVTVPRLIDPLRGSGATRLGGTRVVGVQVKIHNRGPGSYDSSSTGDVTIVPASGSAAAAYVPQGSCMTQLRDFDNQIAVGETRSGCIAFTLDAGARVVAVRFAANGGGEGAATWRGRAP